MKNIYIYRLDRLPRSDTDEETPFLQLKILNVTFYIIITFGFIIRLKCYFFLEICKKK